MQSRSGSMHADDTPWLDLGRPIGTILTPNAGGKPQMLQRATLYMRDYMSVETFQKTIAK